MRRLLSILLALGLVLSFSLVTAVPALGADLYVPSPSYPTISSALLAAFPGDTIYVAAGTYNEDIVLVNEVSVLGAGADVTTIIGTGTGSVVTAADVDPGTVFDGFTVTGGDAGFGGGMRLSNSSLTVSNCIFDTNSATNHGGGMYNLDSSPTVANCIFDTNSATFLGGGIYCRNNSNPDITNCTIVNNTATNGGGIYIHTSSPNITNNIIAGNTATTSGGGIFVFSYTPTIDYNDVYGNTAAVGGTENYGGTAAAGANDISADPAFVDEVTDDYHLDETVPSPCIDAGSNSAPSLPGTDFEGEPRVFDGDGDGTATADMGADEYYVPPPPPRGTVGGTVRPVDKTALLLPWLGLGAVLILAAGGLILIRRRSQ
jgi:serine protease